MTVKKNDKVKVHYIGTLINGAIFDKSSNDEPLDFIVGAGQLIPDFEQAVVGMELNEEKRITIKAENAYGLRNEKLLIEFPKSSFPNDFKFEKGMTIALKDQVGEEIPAKIISIGQESISLDLNHRLAGEDLHFSMKIVSIN